MECRSSFNLLAQIRRGIQQEPRLAIIRNGDLGTTFEFNLQAGAGTHFFVQKDLALTFQYRFIHLSNAGMEFPNLGVNTSTFLLGFSWFF